MRKGLQHADTASVARGRRMRVAVALVARSSFSALTEHQGLLKLAAQPLPYTLFPSHAQFAIRSVCIAPHTSGALNHPSRSMLMEQSRMKKLEPEPEPDDKDFCYGQEYRKRTLKLVREMPFVGLFRNLPKVSCMDGENRDQDSNTHLHANKAKGNLLDQSSTLYPTGAMCCCPAPQTDCTPNHSHA